MRANGAKGVFDGGADSRDMEFSLGGGIIASSHAPFPRWSRRGLVFAAQLQRGRIVIPCCKILSVKDLLTLCQR